MNIQHKKYLKIVNDLHETAEAFLKRSETDYRGYIKHLSSKLSEYVSKLDKLETEIVDISRNKQRSRHRYAVVYRHSLKEDIKKSVPNGDGTTTTPCYWVYEYVGSVEIENGLLTIDEIFEDVSVALDINIAREKPTGNYSKRPFISSTDENGDDFMFFNETNGCYIAAIGYNKQYTEKEMRSYAKRNNKR